MQTVFSLQELEGMMLANSKAIQGASNAVESARFAVKTAQAIPNPHIEVLNGTRTPRVATTNTDGSLKTISINQDVDMPWHRLPRVDAATADPHDAVDCLENVAVARDGQRYLFVRDHEYCVE